MNELILFSLGFLSQNSLLRLSLNRGYKVIYIVGWEGMGKVIFWQTGSSERFVMPHQLKKNFKKKFSLLVPTCSPPNPTTHHTIHSLFSLFRRSLSLLFTFLFLFHQHNTYTHTPLPHHPTGTFLIITSTIFSGKITRKSSRTSHLHISYLR